MVLVIIYFNIIDLVNEIMNLNLIFGVDNIFFGVNNILFMDFNVIWGKFICYYY